MCTEMYIYLVKNAEMYVPRKACKSLIGQKHQKTQYSTTLKQMLKVTFNANKLKLSNLMLFLNQHSYFML